MPIRTARVFLAVSALLTAVAHPARAATLDCNGPPYADDLSNLVAAVVTGRRVNFLVNQTDKADCPSAEASCRRKGFVLAGNPVVTDGDVVKGGYVCAAYIDDHGNETDGWLPADQVKAAPVPPDWVGRWKRDKTAELDIKRGAHGRLDLSGNASHGHGAGTNVGDIDAELDPAKQTQGFALAADKQIAVSKAESTDCVVRLAQLGPYLFADDNNNCGGFNVTFRGLYRR